ncbi:BlaI/MecI/CopY family transcriptional regulator [Mycobacterium sp. CVI_P3]|uniref:BlaI/MecI/CopY family transcriptional regulator n=1 Tax=Mycobacterium pinniadriaticum TaxID=2994102 RepID=A0ABT3SDD9_9MYCO|nr:BlaI/MecI/CopY family transcriptional regulator [Mycobacterium pinniadriaticum]MCX2931245.1 BlaI/MecI/CopY family transcriptional regulator [Mycobacterium pinniadriaticum]MCX2937531.1 BlaI/MecI/CopY family transcriptional regulator [Mycobacterium pinniadriaticum]
MRRQPGSLEDAIIAVLGRHPAMSVAAVRAELGGDLAHTTVMTALVRLTDKQLVTRTKTGRAYRYSLAVPAGELPALRTAIKMRDELHRRLAPDRADVLANFVAALDPADEAALRRLLSDDDASAS